MCKSPLFTLLRLAKGRGAILIIVVVHGVAIGLLVHHVGRVRFEGRGELIAGANQESLVGHQSAQGLEQRNVYINSKLHSHSAIDR